MFKLEIKLKENMKKELRNKKYANVWKNHLKD